MVELASEAADMPQLYNFRTRLSEIGGAAPRRLAGLAAEEIEVPLLDPPPLRDSSYAASIVGADSTRVHEGTLSVSAVSDLADGRIRIDGELVCESLAAAAPTSKDLIEVRVRQGRPLPLVVELFSRGRSTGSGALRLQSLPLDTDPSTAKQMRALAGEPPIRATVILHRCLHVPCDLQSLGLILFSTLAANSEQSAAAVLAAARQISDEIGRFVQKGPEMSPEEIDEKALDALRRLEAQGVLARRQLFFAPSAHPDPRSRIPDSFWYGALTLGLRALTVAPGFGLCRSYDDFDPRHPEGPAEHLCAELAVLSHKIDEELLGIQGKKRVFSKAVAKVRGVLEADAGDGMDERVGR